MPRISSSAPAVPSPHDRTVSAQVEPFPTVATAIRRFLGYFVVPLCLAVPVGLYLALASGLSETQRETATALIVLAGTDLGLAYVIWAAYRDLRARQAGRAEALGLTPATAGQLWTAALLGTGLVSYDLARIGLEADGPALIRPLFPGMLAVYPPITMVVLVPAAEELLFRGYIFAAVRERSGTAIAATISTLLFLAIHPYRIAEHWYAVLPLVGLSAISLAFLQRTRSLLPGIAAHLAYNAAVVGVMFR